MHIMEHRLQRHKKPIVCQIISLLLTAVALAASCQACREGSVVEKSLTPSLPGFTYSTYSGAIWQIDINGHKTQLLPDDGIHKSDLSWSPNRQRLAYVTLEYVQSGTRESAFTTFTTTEDIAATTPPEILTHVVQKTLFVLDVDDSNRKQLAGPVRAIQYTWADDRTIDLRFAHKVSDGSERQQWERFLTDVETGAMSLVEQTDKNMLEFIKPSPDKRWGLSLETVGDARRLYLLDTKGDKVSMIYEGPSGRSVLFQWSPDSRYVFYLGYAFYDADDISVYDLSVGKTTKVTHFTEQKNAFTISPPRWSPTGEWISFWLDSAGRTNQPCVVSLSRGQTQCFDISAKSGRLNWSADGRYFAFLAPQGDAPIDIYAVDAKMGRLINLTSDGNDEIEFEVAP
jgi:Tol biopolymer transport system component